ncbi:MAG: beta-eliminating lyase-related protein [Pseudomonadota bacterium]
MHFASDNTGPTHPKILEAVIAANAGYAMPYGADPWEETATAQIRDTFEAPDAEVFFVATGSGGNSMALGAMCPPWGTIFCHEMAHVLIDESHGPTFYAGGAAFAPVSGERGKMAPDALSAALEKYAPGNIHTPARGPLTLTNVTEVGSVYTLDEIDALAALARSVGLPVHLDGARFANACAALGCTAAEMTWKRGIDAVTFGGTKNGCMGVEAVIFFDGRFSEAFERQRMRGGHLFSKHRALSAQMAAYTADGLWRELGARANAAAANLVEAMGNHVEYVHRPDANLMFVKFPRALHRKLHAAGAEFYSFADENTGPDDEPITARLVCDWSATSENTERFASLLKAG